MEKYGGNLRKVKRVTPRTRTGSGLGAAVGKAAPKPKRDYVAELDRKLTKTHPVVRVKPVPGAAFGKATGARPQAQLPVVKHFNKVVPIQSGNGGGLKGLVGAGRVLVHATEALGQDIIKHPVDAAVKTATSGAEIVKGVAGAALGVPVAAVRQSVDKALHPTGGSGKVDSADTVVARMASETAKSYSKKYGPSYRGEKGARAKLAKQVQKEGPLLTGLDIATVLAPVSSGVGKLAKAGERVRPTLKVEPLKPGVKQHSRPSAIGASINIGHDALRKASQAAAAARSQQRLRTRLPGVSAHSEPGRKPTLLNTEPKPLTARRAALAPGEVAPVIERAANRTLRRSVAERHTRGRSAATYRAARHVTGKKGSVRAAFKPLHEDLHHTAITAAQLGIKDSAGAASVLPVRLAEIERARVAALARKGVHGKKDAAAEARAAKTGATGEEALLRGYLADPAVFDNPAVQHAADAIRNTPVGAREGLGVEQAAYGRSQLVGGTLGVKPQAELNAEARAAHAAEVAAKRGTVAAKRAEVVKLQRTVDTQRAVAREAAVGTRVKVTDLPTLKAIGRNAAKVDKRAQVAARAELRAAEREHAAARAAIGEAKGRSEALGMVIGGKAGGVGKLQAAERMAAAERRLEVARRGVRPGLQRLAQRAEPLVRDTAGLRTAKQELSVAKQAARSLPKAPKAAYESGPAYEARVVAAAAERGLTAPAYVPSHFEKAGLHSDAHSNGPANPIGQKRSGTLYRLGREHKTLDVVEKSMISSLRRGATKQAEGHILGLHGMGFASEQDAKDFAAGLGLNTDPARGRVDVALHSPSSSEAVKGQLPPRTRPSSGRPVKGADQGDYVKTDGVFLLPAAVKQELDALGLAATSPASALQKLAHYPQAALLALSPSWFQFQRLNDALAAAVGGSLHHSVALEKLRKSLDPDSREMLHMMSGGSISSEMLTPFSAQKIGRMQRLLDENRIYQKAFGGKNPATALLRADQAITQGVRERQLLHNLSIVARKMDPDVSAVRDAFGPIGHAFKTADAELAQKLLKDPRYQAQLEDAAQRLYKIHGDWHNYTAREQSLKHYAAFYGFLRYATRMALYTLPVQHPYVGMLIGQLGHMGAEDAKAIIGPDIPYGLGALYSKDGTILADISRANPILGPLFSINKPEQLASLMTPLAGIALNYMFGQPLALNDSSEGRVTQYTVGGDPANHRVGSFGGEARNRIGLRALLNLLSPPRAWDKFDSKQQSSDSLPWDRRYLAAPENPSQQLRIDAKNAAAAGAGGGAGLLHDQLPLAFPGSKKNMKAQGQAIAAAKQQSADAQALHDAKRFGALHTSGGAAQARIDKILAKIDAEQAPANDRVNAILRKIQIEQLRSGSGG